MKLLASFSGGKDSILSIDRAINQNHEIVGLITTMKDDESWFHEIDKSLLDKISKSLNIPIYKINVRGGADYTQDFIENLKEIIDKTNAEGIIFGDIDLMEHRKWCEGIAKKSDTTPIFPLWQEDRKKLVLEFLEKGYRTIIKKVAKEKLDKKYLTKELSFELIKEFQKLGIDECGENGEYHTIVIDGPIFLNKVEISFGNIYEDNWSYIVETN